MTPVLLDTSVIVAWLDQDEKRHDECSIAVKQLQRPLVTCEAVIAESCYLVSKLDGAQDAILQNVEKEIFRIPFQLSRSTAAVRNLMLKYHDLPADFADACLIQLADELNSGDILTLDSHFQVYRWRKVRPFHLLID